MTTNPFTAEPPDGEALVEGGTWLLDLVAAVDHLRRGHRPGLTVWDALEEALRWSTTAHDESVWDAPDPLASTLRRSLEQAAGPAAVILQTAVRRWVTVMADRYNDGHHWPHPAPRRGFPPPSIHPAVEEDLTADEDRPWR